MEKASKNTSDELFNEILLLLFGKLMDHITYTLTREETWFEKLLIKILIALDNFAEKISIAILEPLKEELEK